MIYGVDNFSDKKRERYFNKLKDCVIMMEFDYLKRCQISDELKNAEIERRLKKWRETKRYDSGDEFDVIRNVVERKLRMDLWIGKLDIIGMCNKYRMSVYDMKKEVKVVKVKEGKRVVPSQDIEKKDYYLWLFGVEIPTTSELTEEEKMYVERECKVKPWVDLIRKKMNTVEQIKADLEKSREESKRLEFLLLSEVGKVEYVIQARQEFEVLKKKYYIGGDKEFLVYLNRVDDGSGNVKTTKTRIRTTITNDLIDKVMGMINENKKPAEIMKETGLSSSSISKIKTGVTKKT